MSVSKNIREQLLSSFRAELNEHVQMMTDGLLALEQNRGTSEERDTVLYDIFRAAHSLKGAARAVGATSIEQLAHKLENVLDGLRKNEIVADAILFNACYQALDAVQLVHTAYEAGEITPPVEALKALVVFDGLKPANIGGSEKDEFSPAGSTKEEIPSEAVQPVAENLPSDANTTSASIGNGTIRVSVDKVDALMTHLSELLVTKTRAEERLVRAQELQELMTIWQREWFSVHSAFSRAIHQDLSGALRRLGPVEKGTGNNTDTRIMGKDIIRLLDYLEISQKRLSESANRINGIVREYDADTTHMSQVIDELGEEIKRVNMLPLSTITGSFARMVRDLAQQAGKQAVLHIIGGETEIDKQVLEQIKDPLIHLLRNAVDHGIELPEVRKSQGKPSEGTITLSVNQSGKDVMISVSDDGAGLNLEEIRQAIQRQERINADQLGEVDIRDAIFRIGITTSPIITDISGRGIGLDVVRKNVEMLHGHISLDWTSGKGSSFKMILPLRLTTSRGLFVKTSGQTYALPINTIDRILMVNPKEIISLEGRKAIRYNDRSINLVDLSEVLGLAPSAPVNGKSIPAIIISIADRCMAFMVDEILDEQEVVMKGLGKQLARVHCIAGCTIMGKGEIVLILNGNDLIKQATREGYRAPLPEALVAVPDEREKKKRILVVDDSITTRMLEKNILEAAGYIVEVATNGQEALNCIHHNGLPDLMVADVIMPVMNGFDLTQSIKNDPQTSQMPIILVTSLDSDEDKARGIEAGAEAYIVKSNFNQNNLLDCIEQLI